MKIALIIIAILEEQEKHTLPELWAGNSSGRIVSILKNLQVAS
jgi:hypothetical protein